MCHHCVRYGVDVSVSPLCKVWGGRWCVITVYTDIQWIKVTGPESVCKTVLSVRTMLVYVYTVLLHMTMYMG